jgi:hypothetical protein
MDTIGAKNTVEIEVDDATGHGIRGLHVSWLASAAGSSITPVSTITDANGISSATWQLGTDLSEDVLTITVPSLPPVTLTQSVREGAPSQVIVQPSHLTLGLVGQILRVSTRFSDRVGHPIPVIRIGFGPFWASTDQNVAVAGLTYGNLDSSDVRAVGAGQATLTISAAAAHGTVDVDVMQLGSFSRTDGRSCAIGSGTTYCWASNEQPAAITTPVPFTQVTVGLQHTCGLASLGAAYCWGINGYGQTGGNPTSLNVPTPTAVSGGHAFRWIGAGRNSSCGITPANDAYCWGNNFYGELGRDTSTTTCYNGSECSSEPIAVAGDLKFANLHLATFFHMCGVVVDGDAYCWGENGSQQLGNAAAPAKSRVPLLVSGGLKWTDVAPGLNESCGITTDGSPYCWGLINAPGQPTAFTSTATAIPGGFRFTAIDLDDRYACGLTSDGAVYCWAQSYSDRVPFKVTSRQSYETIALDQGLVCGSTALHAIACEPIQP